MVICPYCATLISGEPGIHLDEVHGLDRGYVGFENVTVTVITGVTDAKIKMADEYGLSKKEKLIGFLATSRTHETSVVAPKKVSDDD